jgi:hypothetical protein
VGFRPVSDVDLLVAFQADNPSLILPQYPPDRLVGKVAAALDGVGSGTRVWPGESVSVNFADGPSVDVFPTFRPYDRNFVKFPRRGSMWMNSAPTPLDRAFHVVLGIPAAVLAAIAGGTDWVPKHVTSVPEVSRGCRHAVNLVRPGTVDASDGPHQHRSVLDRRPPHDAGAVPVPAHAIRRLTVPWPMLPEAQTRPAAGGRDTAVRGPNWPWTRYARAGLKEVIPAVA